MARLDYATLRRMAAVRAAQQLAAAIRRPFPDAEYATFYTEVFEDCAVEYTWVEIRDHDHRVLWEDNLEPEELSWRVRVFRRTRQNLPVTPLPEPAWVRDCPPLAELDELVSHDGVVLRHDEDDDDTSTFRLSAIDLMTVRG